jgi:hypothetical protein
MKRWWRCFWEGHNWEEVTRYKVTWTFFNGRIREAYEVVMRCTRCTKRRSVIE